MLAGSPKRRGLHRMARAASLEYNKMPHDQLDRDRPDRLHVSLDRLHIDLHQDPSIERVFSQLVQINTKLETIMAGLTEAMEALSAINTATNEQSTRLTEVAETSQEISDDIDKLLADAGTNVPADVVTKLKEAATNAAAISTSLTAHAAFAKAIASKSPVEPVPVPVPDPIA